MTMRDLRQILSGVLAAALVLPSLAGAQTPTLGDLAKREQERRKATKSSDKVLTNKDLPASAQQPAPASGTSTSTPSTAAAPAGGAAKPAAGDDRKTAGAPSDQKDEASWRKRISEARESLRRNEAFLEALQSRVNALSTDFVNRDDPYQRARIADDRQKALAEMDRLKADIELGKKHIDDIEEEARKAGVPPGWLR